MINSVSFNIINNQYINKQNLQNGVSKPLFANTNNVELSNYEVGQAILNRNNISFRNLTTPIEVTDKYNKKTEGKDHLDLPNIHVYEYPDTNLQVFINKNNNSSNDKEKVVMALDIYNKNTDNDNKSLMQKELCTRLLCNLINDNNCFVTTFDSNFFSIKYNLKTNEIDKIANINKLISKPNFSVANLEIVKDDCIKDIEQIRNCNSQNVINEIKKITIDDINKFYYNAINNSEARLFVVVDKDYYNNANKQLNKIFNSNFSNKFLKHTNVNDINTNNINNKQVIFNDQDNDAYLEFQYSMPMNNLKNKKIGEYLSLLMMLYKSPYVLPNSTPIMYNLDSDLNLKLANETQSPFLRFKVMLSGRENINDTENAIDTIKAMFVSLCNDDMAKLTLEDLKKQDKKEIEKALIHNSDIYKQAQLLQDNNYDIFDIYEQIDSITIDDVKRAIVDYILEQQPIVYINENLNPYKKEVDYA